MPIHASNNVIQEPRLELLVAIQLQIRFAAQTAGRSSDATHAARDTTGDLVCSRNADVLVTSCSPALLGALPYL